MDYRQRVKLMASAILNFIIVLGLCIACVWLYRVAVGSESAVNKESFELVETGVNRNNHNAPELIYARKFSDNVVPHRVEIWMIEDFSVDENGNYQPYYFEHIVSE